MWPWTSPISVGLSWCPSVVVLEGVPGIQPLLLTLPILRVLSSKAQGRKDLRKSYKPYHVGTHYLKALAEYTKMSTHMIWFFKFLHHLVLAKLSTSSILRVMSQWGDVRDIWRFRRWFWCVMKHCVYVERFFISSIRAGWLQAVWL